MYINYITFHFLINNSIIMYLIYQLTIIIILLYIIFIKGSSENSKYIIKSIVKLFHNIFNNLIFWRYLYLTYIFALF